MSFNPIDEIKQAEAAAQAVITAAKQKAEEAQIAAERDGRAAINSVQEHAKDDLQQIVQETKKLVQKLKAEHERQLTAELAAIQAVDQKKIAAAAETVTTAFVETIKAGK